MLDKRLEGRRNQTVVVVTHFPIASGDPVSVKSTFGGGVAPTGLFAAAAGAGLAVHSCGTGSAVLTRAVRLRVQLLRNGTPAAVMTLLSASGVRGYAAI